MVGKYYKISIRKRGKAVGVGGVVGGVVGDGGYEVDLEMGGLGGRGGRGVRGVREIGRAHV